MAFMSDRDNKVLVARHGSWNRSKKSGYDVVQVDTKTGKVSSFISGWLNKDENEAWGRPVDVLALKDGGYLISDDMAGAVYKLSQKK